MRKELVYEQATGILRLVEDGVASRLGRGYSGHPPFVNAPDAEALPSRGPIPRGTYRIGGPYDILRIGPRCFILEPDKANDMHGRSGFLIHGDNEFGDQSASHGCIILSRSIRDRIAAEGVKVLKVA